MFLLLVLFQGSGAASVMSFALKEHLAHTLEPPAPRTAVPKECAALEVSRWHCGWRRVGIMHPDVKGIAKG